MLKRDLQRNIEVCYESGDLLAKRDSDSCSIVSVFSSQTHGSPGAFWEQEQESLLFVIEMKRERLQDQGNKLLQMETLV